MRLLYCVVALAVANAACSPLRVRCDGRLRPINVTTPAPDPVASGDPRGSKSSTPAGRSLSGTKP
jgi:hypothetical protein